MKRITCGFLLVLFMSVLSSCNSMQTKETKDLTDVNIISYENGEQTNTSTNSLIIGVWNLTNPSEEMKKVEFTFNSDGSFVLYGVKKGLGIFDEEGEEKNIKGFWSMNGDRIYLTTPGESEVGIIEILSLDKKSLVIHFKGEPQKEILYYVKEQ